MKYTKERLEEAVANSKSIAGVLRYLGMVQAGGNHTHISRSIKRFGIDTGHFTGQGWSRGRKFAPRTPPADRLVLMPPGSPRMKPPVLRRALLSLGRAYVCAFCGNSGSWMFKPLTLHVDHINGNYLATAQTTCGSSAPTAMHRHRPTQVAIADAGLCGRRTRSWSCHPKSRPPHDFGSDAAALGT